MSERDSGNDCKDSGSLKTIKKEAEMVDSTWLEYFLRYSNPLLDDQTFQSSLDLFDRFYGDFFERNLSVHQGPLLSLGSGYGGSEIPLAVKGFKVIGIENDSGVIDLARKNADKYGEKRFTMVKGNLYDDFHIDFLNKGIQASVSFGVLEHFARKDLDEIISKQFKISDKMIFMVPVRTANTLRAFDAESKPEGHVDASGIYRNFWTETFWEREVLRDYEVFDQHPLSSRKKRLPL